MHGAEEPSRERPAGRPGRVLLGCGVIWLLLASGALLGLARGGGWLAGGGGQIAVLDVQGMIMAEAGEAGLLFGAAGTAGLQRDLRAALSDPTVAAIVLRINSPGGTAAASQEIYEQVRAGRDTKPIVASLADMGTSGAYYIASACDKIVANRATMTGSIGVIMSNLNFAGLMQRYGVADATITSGSFKDTGSPYRPQREDERALMQTMIDSTYEQFLGDVAQGRGLPLEQVRPLADGRVLTGEQAHEAGLVDHLGGYAAALELAANLAGVPSTNVRVKRYRPTGLRALLGVGGALGPASRAAGLSPTANLLPPVLLVAPGVLPQAAAASWLALPAPPR